MKPLNLNLNPDQLEIINYGLSLIPQIQLALPELALSKNVQINNKLAKSTLEVLRSKPKKLTSNQFKLLAMSIYGLYLILQKEIYIDEKTLNYVENNSQNIKILHAILDSYFNL